MGQRGVGLDSVRVDGKSHERPITVLHVDDEPDFADLVATYLERSHEAISVATATTAREGLDELAERPIDCIVSDHDMPGMNGLEFLRAVREEYPEIPFVLFTGKGNEEIASDAISAGVTEYLQKGVGTDQYAVLANRIERAVEEYRAKAALEESERMFSTLVSNLPGMAYRCRNEPDWPMEFVSEGCRELTGYDPEALVDGDVVWGEDVLHPEERDRAWETVQEALDARNPFEITYRIVTADGRTKQVWEQGQGVFDGDELVALEGIIMDVERSVSRLLDSDGGDSRRTLVTDRIDEPVVAVDTDRTITYCNDAAAAVLGRERGAVEGHDLCVVTPDEVRPKLADEYDRAVESGEPVRFDLYYVPTGRHFDVTMYPGPSGMSVYARDVTDRREQEAKLEQYRTLVENVGDPMYVLDTEATVQMANRAMAEHLGYEREEIVGAHVSMFMPESDVETGTELIEELLTSDRTWESFEMESIRSDGTRSHNEDKIAVLTDDDGEHVGSVGIIRDITERKERERELRRYETIIQAVGDPVYAADEDGRFTFVNDAFTELLGYEPEELIGEHASVVLDEDSQAVPEQHIRRLFTEDDLTYATFEVDLVARDGTPVPTEVHIALLGSDDERLEGTAGVVRDITERKQREQRLEEFTSVVSHDLQSPLNVVSGRAELALETGNLDHVESIVEATERMEHLVEDLLTLARKGRTVGETEATPLSTVVEGAWSEVRTLDADLIVETDATVEADPDRLRELFANLFRNSVEHGSTGNRTQSGAAVTVTVDTLPDAEGFAVADDGRGIAPEDRDAVFEHGYTTSDSGSGLGLAIVERIVQAHGWSIDVTESAQGGARFVVVTG